MQSTADASIMKKVGKLLDETVGNEPNISSAAVMTADGFPLVLLMGKGEVEKLEIAASIASLGSLSEQTANRIGLGQYKDMMLRGRRGHLLVRRVGDANMLAVLTDRNAQLGAVQLVLDSLVRRLNRLLK